MGILMTVWYTIIGLFLKTFVWGMVICATYNICLLITKRRRQWELKKSIVEFIFCCYVVAVLDLTGVLEFKFSGWSMMPNLIPILTTAKDIFNNGLYVLEQVALNVALYIPFGILVPILLNSNKKTIIKVIAISFAMSLTTETLQYFGGRYADIDDIIFNITGALIGYFVYITWTKLKSKRIVAHDKVK